MPSSGKMAVNPLEGAQQRVLIKLIIFAFLVALLPIATYFASLHIFFKGNVVWAAVLAVVAANIVLFGYVYMAFNEDKVEQAVLLQKKIG